jgi:hypothetical protein
VWKLKLLKQRFKSWAKQAEVKKKLKISPAGGGYPGHGSGDHKGGLENKDRQPLKYPRGRT